MTEIKKFDYHYNFYHSIITTNISRFYRRWWGRSKSFTPGLGLATHRHSLPPAQPHPEQLWSVCSSYFGKCFQYIITHRPTTEPEQLMFVILPKIREKNEEKKLIAPPMYLWSLSTFSISCYTRHPTVFEKAFRITNISEITTHMFNISLPPGLPDQEQHIFAWLSYFEIFKNIQKKASHHTYDVFEISNFTLSMFWIFHCPLPYHTQNNY